MNGTHASTRRIISNVVTGCLLAIGLCTVIVISARDTPESVRQAQGSPSAPASVGQVVQLRLDTHQTFEAVSVPSASSDILSDQEAWRLFEDDEGGGLMQVPDGVAVEYGLLTIPTQAIGPVSQWIYKVKDHAVWSYSKVGPCVNFNPYATNSGTCREWIFVDAVAGDLIEKIYQPVD